MAFAEHLRSYAELINTWKAIRPSTPLTFFVCAFDVTGTQADLLRTQSRQPRLTTFGGHRRGAGENAGFVNSHEIIR